MTMDEIAEVLDEDRPQETPAEIARLAPDDPGLVVFTSGTSGEPRAALHAQRYLPGQRAQAEHWLGARDGELAWCTTATGWSKSARNVFLAPWLCGAAAMLVDGRFEPAERLELIERERVDVLCQAPTEYRVLAKRAELGELPSVRRMVSAGEALNPEVIDAWREATGVTICDGYGQTETGHLVGNHVGEAVREGSMGAPCPGSSCGSPRASCSSGSRAARPSSTATSTTSRSRANGGRRATSCAPTKTATTGTRGATTT